MKQERVKNPDVAKVFEGYPEATREKLMFLRQLIFDTAAKTEGVGELEETLKWGEPSYLTPQSKSGSTIRIAWKKSQAGEYAMYFNCQTDLIATFKQMYPNEFTYEGKRSIIFNANDEIPVEELSDCISLALTYHLYKKVRKQV